MSIKSLAVPLLCAFMLATFQAGFAQGTSSKGQGSVEYKRKKVNAEHRREALQKAKFNAVQQYVSSQGQAKLRNFELVSATVKENIDQYILEHTIIEESQVKDSKLFTVYIRAQVDSAKIANLLGDATGSVGSGDAVEMIGIFFARQQRSVTSFSESKQGNATTQKSDEIKYDVFNSDGLEASILNVFSDNGYELYMTGDQMKLDTLGKIDKNKLKNDYQFGDDVKDTTMARVAEGAKMIDIRYIATGTLDVGVKDTDPATGQTRVSVRVIGRVIDVSKRYPRTLVTYGPEQIIALGRNETDARTTALKLAAEELAKKIVDKLQAKKLQ